MLVGSSVGAGGGNKEGGIKFPAFDAERNSLHSILSLCGRRNAMRGLGGVYILIVPSIIYIYYI